MRGVTQLIVWLDGLASRCASVLLQPVVALPGWLSATLVAAVTGVLMLLVFKYTSNQAAVKRVRDDIKANLLALSLFKDSAVVSLRSQGRIIVAAVRLLSLSVVPMLAMSVPMVLLLGQLALWYQARPLHVGEEAVITVHVTALDGELPDVQLVNTAAIEPTIGPVRVARRQMLCWSVRVREPGYHRLMFAVEGKTFAKELAVGNGFMRVSQRRPPWRWSDVILHPAERPFAVDSIIQSIDVAYPDRSSWTAGSNTWLLYWFSVSMAFAFATRPLLKVNL